MAARMTSLARVAVRRSVDWNTLSGKLSGGAKSELFRMRAAFDDIKSSNAKVTEEVPPIDFAKYKTLVRDPDVVDNFETAYNKMEVPNFVFEIESETQSQLDKLLSDAKAAGETSKVRLAELEESLAALHANRTTEDTTIDDVCARYPEFEKEIEEDIKGLKWSKDIA